MIWLSPLGDEKEEATLLPETPRQIQEDTFFSLSATEAARKYLQMAKRPAGTKEIEEALKRGGFLTNAKNFYCNLYTSLNRSSDFAAFCAAKQKNVPVQHRGEKGWGDTWTFTALCADTKLIPSWLVGDRDEQTATLFLSDLASRLAGRAQVTTDGHLMYLGAVETAFAGDADYAMLVKSYGVSPESERQYSPAVCTGSKKARIKGEPDMSRVSTSYVERTNLGIRIGLRRFTRLTNAHSKKLQNHCAALAIYFMYYNFARIHSTIRCSPAMAAGVTPHLWSVEEIVGLLPVEAPKKRGPYRKRAA